MMMIIYVDELIILTSYMTKIEWFKLKLNKEYNMSDLGKLYYFMRIILEKQDKTYYNHKPKKVH